MKIWFVFALAITSSGPLFAGCGGGGDSNGSGGSGSVEGDSATCLPFGSTIMIPACRSCVESACSSQFTAFCEGACGTLVAPAGCESTQQAFITCVAQQCASECQVPVSQVVNGGEAGAAALLPSCAKLGACCTSLAPIMGLERDCQLVVMQNNAQSCDQTFTDDALYCADPTLLTRAYPCIYSTQGKCVIAFGVPIDQKTAADVACGDMGGMSAETCPTGDLLGCCKIPTSGETCFYSNAGAPMTQADCAQAGGTWLAMPD